MRVGLVIYGSLDTVTGGYLYDRQLVDHLRAQGDTVDVISLPPKPYALSLADNLSPATARLLTGAHVEVLLQDELCHPSLVEWNRRSAASRRCPIVTLLHLLRSDDRHGVAERGLYAAVERRYLATVDAAVFNSAATRMSAERLLGRPLPGVVAPPAADHVPLPATVDRSSASGPLRVISVANVIPRKGALPLVDALALLPAGAWRLTLAGSVTTDPGYVARVRRRIAELGAETNVDLLGEVANADVPALLANHDVLAVPSSHEPAGIAYLEAMRIGRPVVATTSGGASEFVADGVEGFLVAPDDVAALSRRLRTWSEDRELVTRMGAAARVRAERHPTWAQTFEPVRELLHSLVHARREAAP